MIDFDIILDCLIAEPFRPFRLHTAEGEVLDVLRPDQATVGIARVSVYRQSGETVGFLRTSLSSSTSIERLEVDPSIKV